ncbi:hypothetical protein NODU109028_03210 [Nocardioides dubius]|uniref:Uncharacterized protein n=1 Tax=Nocardioides dubius TaxID=317019 RepID=A0ABN1TL03_9ACTN
MRPCDPFDLPDWLGTAEVTWSAVSTDRGGHRVRGELSAGAQLMPCDLFAVDQAWPAPVADDVLRHEVHTAWRSGEVVLATEQERLLILTPGVCFAPADALEAVRRLARAVAAQPEHYVVALRLDAWATRGTSADRG